MAKGKGPSATPRERRQFTAEFTAEAVRRAAERRAAGVPLTQMARELGVTDDLRRNWRRRVAAREGAPPAAVFPGNGRLPSDEDEVRRLKRELARTQQEVAGRLNGSVQHPVCPPRPRRLMAKIGRPGLPSDKRQEVWERWKAGDSISVIAKSVGSPPGSIFSILLPFGGIYQPPQRRRAAALSLAEREEISRGVAADESYRAIGRRLGRPASTISREVARNRGAAKYRAVDADDRAWRRAKRPKPCLLARRPALATYVRDRLREDWSPEQMAGTLKKQHADGSAMRVSHETIYRTLFVESRGVLARELRAHLRSGRPLRRSVHNTTAGQWRSQIQGAVSIRDRPAEVADRAVPGHWEGDLLLGRHWTQLATLVERTTRFTVLVQLPGRDMQAVTAGLSREMAALPEHVGRTLTWDRGMELADHHSVTANTGLDVYFADPHSPWQRGTNENTNRLLRQYFPKGVTMKGLTQDDLNQVAAKLNARPRKTLDFDTPAARFEALLR